MIKTKITTNKTSNVELEWSDKLIIKNIMNNSIEFQSWLVRNYNKHFDPIENQIMNDTKPFLKTIYSLFVDLFMLRDSYDRPLVSVENRLEILRDLFKNKILTGTIILNDKTLTRYTNFDYTGHIFYKSDNEIFLFNIEKYLNVLIYLIKQNVQTVAVKYNWNGMLLDDLIKIKDQKF